MSKSKFWVVYTYLNVVYLIAFVIELNARVNVNELLLELNIIIINFPYQLLGSTLFALCIYC